MSLLRKPKYAKKSWEPKFSLLLESQQKAASEFAEFRTREGARRRYSDTNKKKMLEDLHAFSLRKWDSKTHAKEYKAFQDAARIHGLRIQLKGVRRWGWGASGAEAPMMKDIVDFFKSLKSWKTFKEQFYRSDMKEGMPNFFGVLIVCGLKLFFLPFGAPFRSYMRWRRRRKLGKELRELEKSVEEEIKQNKTTAQVYLAYFDELDKKGKGAVKVFEDLQEPRKGKEAAEFKKWQLQKKKKAA